VLLKYILHKYPLGCPGLMASSFGSRLLLISEGFYTGSSAFFALNHVPRLKGLNWEDIHKE